MSKNVRQAYVWLIQNCCDETELFIFGFSRGACTARSLAGLIARCGIARRTSDVEKLAENAYQLYRSSREDNDESRDFRKNRAYEVRIRFLGVWDTVGAVGQIAAKFHNTTLCDNVDNAYHAVAIDEHRKAYDAVLWSHNPYNAKVEQRWFPGAHANIGGGYQDDLLPDISFRWMLERAWDCGLYLGERNGSPIRPQDVQPLDQGEFRSPAIDSYREFAFGAYSVDEEASRRFLDDYSRTILQNPLPFGQTKFPRKRFTMRPTLTTLTLCLCRLKPESSWVLVQKSAAPLGPCPMRQ